MLACVYLAALSFYKLHKANRTGHRDSGVTTTRTQSFLRYNREPLLLMVAVGVFTLLNAIGVGYALNSSTGAQVRDACAAISTHMKLSALTRKRLLVLRAQ